MALDHILFIQSLFCLFSSITSIEALLEGLFKCVFNTSFYFLCFCLKGLGWHLFIFVKKIYLSWWCHPLDIWYRATIKLSLICLFLGTGVVFIRPCDTATRYMVTLHKNDKVQRLRRELQTMTGTEKNDVILAEVLDNHVSRLLVSVL